MCIRDRAVSKPVEGTILTVARETARGARSAARSGADIIGIIETAIKNGKKALARTTEMLPVLKEAGVVDAGGMGPVSYTHLDVYKRQVPEKLVGMKSQNNVKILHPSLSLPWADLCRSPV